MVLTIRQWLYLALGIALLVLGSCLWIKGGSKPRAALKVAKVEAKAVAKSNKISVETQTRVEVQGAEVRDRTSAAQEVVRDRIREVPMPVGPADADLLRVATEAHDRALRAACRVQRTDGCAEASGSGRQ